LTGVSVRESRRSGLPQGIANDERLQLHDQARWSSRSLNPYLDARGVESAAAVGGACLRSADHSAAGSIDALPHAVDSRPNVDLTTVSDPHSWPISILAICPELGVADNAAVWIDGRKLPHRVVFVITNHLLLVSHGRDIVADIHEAYGRLADRQRNDGLFVSSWSSGQRCAIHTAANRCID